MVVRTFHRSNLAKVQLRCGWICRERRGQLASTVLGADSRRPVGFGQSWPQETRAGQGGMAFLGLSSSVPWEVSPSLNSSRISDDTSYEGSRLVHFFFLADFQTLQSAEGLWRAFSRLFSAASTVAPTT